MQNRWQESWPNWIQWFEIVTLIIFQISHNHHQKTMFIVKIEIVMKKSVKNRLSIPLCDKILYLQIGWLSTSAVDN